MIDKNLDMNICTEAPIIKKCFSCKKKHKTNHYIVAGDGLILLCTECLEKMALKALERCGYKKVFKKYLKKQTRKE